MRIKEADPAAKTAFLYEDGPIDFIPYALKYNVDAIHPWVYNLRYPGLMADAKAHGLKVNVWTVNTEEDLAYCDQMGADAIITNLPDVARKYYENH